MGERANIVVRSGNEVYETFYGHWAADDAIRCAANAVENGQTLTELIDALAEECGNSFEKTGGKRYSPDYPEVIIEADRETIRLDHGTEYSYGAWKSQATELPGRYYEAFEVMKYRLAEYEVSASPKKGQPAIRVTWTKTVDVDLDEVPDGLAGIHAYLQTIDWSGVQTVFGLRNEGEDN